MPHAAALLRQFLLASKTSAVSGQPSVKQTSFDYSFVNILTFDMRSKAFGLELLSEPQWLPILLSIPLFTIVAPPCVTAMLFLCNWSASTLVGHVFKEFPFCSRSV